MVTCFEIGQLIVWQVLSQWCGHGAKGVDGEVGDDETNVLRGAEKDKSPRAIAFGTEARHILPHHLPELGVGESGTVVVDSKAVRRG